jgi:two-component system cell cycle sensor histidine kinase/response regulator CckA
MKRLESIRQLLVYWPAAAAVGVAVVAGVAIGSFRGKADASRQAEIQLAQLDAAAHELQAMEWKAIAERVVREETSAVAAGVRDESRIALAKLVRLGETAASRDVGRAFRRYERVVQEELALVRAGRIAAAHRLDENAVDPAFADLHREIGLADTALRPRVAANLRRAEIGSALVLALATLSWMLLVQRFVRQRRRSVARAAHAEGERRLLALAENSSDIVMVVDSAGVVRYLSGPTRRVVAREVADAVGKSALDLVHPDDRERALELISVPPGPADSGDLRFAAGDGSGWRILETFASNRSDEPAIGGAVLNLHDVTARRALEGQLQQAQKLEAVGRLAGGVAHDFNNILMAISGYTELLGVREPAFRDREEIRGIAGATRHAAALTQQLLAFSRRQELRPRVLDPRAVVVGIEPMLRRLIREDIELVTRCEREVGRVRADPVQLEQVLLNLVVNACDALPEGGSVTIAVHGETDHAVLSVSDTGTGMDAETQAQVFDPFFTTKGLEGTGLGLATVYGIVEQSGGRIAVESEPGAGTTFSIHLPLVAAPLDRVAPTRDAPALRRGDSHTVLLAEDDSRVRGLLSRLLEAAGYSVLEAANGEDALDMATSFDGVIDVLVTDAVMPGIRGRELADRLCVLLPDLKVLFISGYTDDRIITDGASATRRFLQKPFGNAELLEAVDALLARERSGSVVA